MKELFKIPATLTKYQGMRNRSLRLVFDTQESLTDEQIAKTTLLLEKFLWLCCFHEETKESEMLELVKDLPQLEVDKDQKTPSQRLRDRMYVYYKQTHSDTSNFNSWYIDALDKIGQNYLDKVN